MQLINVVMIGLEFVFSNLFDNQRESALFVVPEESRFAHFLSSGAEFL